MRRLRRGPRLGNIGPHPVGLGAEPWPSTGSSPPSARDLPLASVMRMTEDRAYQWFYRARWGRGEPTCPFCGVVEAYRLTRNGRRWNRFRCREPACRREFTVTSQTIFSDHKLSFRKMLAVMALWVHSVKGKAALQVCREVGISYRSAYVLLMKLREAIAAAQPPEPLDGVVEIDGAYVGGFPAPGEPSSGSRRCATRRERPPGRTPGRDRTPAASGGRAPRPRVRYRGRRAKWSTTLRTSSSGK